MGKVKKALPESRFCACCNKEFGKDLRKTKKFRATGLSNGVHAFDEYDPGNVEVTVSVSTAVKEILSWKCDKSVPYGFVESNLAMCSGCGIIIAKLYTAVKVFQDVKSEISAVNDIARRLIESDQHSKATDTDEDKQYEEAYVAAWGADEQLHLDPDHFVDVRQYPLPLPDDWETDGNNGEANTFRKFKKRHKDNSQKEFPCPRCPAGFDKATNLTRHLLLTHEVGERAKNFHCNVCGKSYYFDYILKNHMKIHGTERPFVCAFPNCAATFKVKRGLQLHIKVKHREGRPFKCRFCLKTFRDERNRVNHETFVHAMPSHVRPHTCQYCNRKYKRLSSIREHYRLNKCPEHPNRTGKIDVRESNIQIDEEDSSPTYVDNEILI